MFSRVVRSSEEQHGSIKHKMTSLSLVLAHETHELLY